MNSHEISGNEVEKFFNFDFKEFSEINFIEKDRIYQFPRKRLFFQNIKLEDEKQVAKVVCHEDIFYFDLKLNNFDENKKNVIIICTRDNSHLLNFTLNRLIGSCGVCDCDILVVDDRSKDEGVLRIAERYKASCLRITNSSNIFNYSMLNNIAVKVVDCFRKENCILWNVDMWPPDDHTLKNLIDKHLASKASLSGVRLLYAKLHDFRELYPNMNHYFGDYAAISETIQHGGMIFSHLPSPFPDHQWRFYPSDEPLACLDRYVHAVTGAYSMVSTKDFIDHGGLNPSLVDFCMDVDFCLKLNSAKKSILYIGSEYLYHAENTLRQYFGTAHHLQDSDCNLFNQVWGPKILNLLGMQAFRK